MIKVLIIEDNLEKLKRVIAFLESECNIPENEIDCANYIVSGRDFLYSGHYDLLLLDLVLPWSETDKPSEESGTKFLDEIYYNPNINIPVHIIGLTEFNNVFNDSIKDFEDKLWGLINFNIQNTDWIDKLKSKIFYLQTFKKRYTDFIENERKFDIAIITALNKEFEQLKSITKCERLNIQDDPLIYYKTILNTKNNNNLKIIICCINQMGMHAAATVSSKIMSMFSPSKLFISGICAGIKSTGVNIGDIIIANQSWDYESGKLIEDETGEWKFKADMQCLPTNHGIIMELTDFSNSKNIISNIYNEFKGKKPDTHINVIFGSVGSGPYVLSSKRYLEKLIESDRKLKGIDMEGFGIYKAAQFHSKTIPVFIKSVSDYGDESKDDNYQDYASFVSAKFIFDFLYHSL